MNRNAKTVLAGLCISALAALSLSVAAAEPPAPTPGPAVAPPPPAMVDEKAAAKANPQPAAPGQVQGDPELEPQVTIIERGDEMHEEVRVNGTIRYIKVTPKVGPVYYLVPVSGTETYMRRDSLDSNLRVPMWQVHSW